MNQYLLIIPVLLILLAIGLLVGLLGKEKKKNKKKKTKKHTAVLFTFQLSFSFLLLFFFFFLLFSFCFFFCFFLFCSAFKKSGSSGSASPYQTFSAIAEVPDGSGGVYHIAAASNLQMDGSGNVQSWALEVVSRYTTEDRESFNMMNEQFAIVAYRDYNGIVQPLHCYPVDTSQVTGLAPTASINQNADGSYTVTLGSTQITATVDLNGVPQTVTYDGVTATIKAFNFGQSSVGKFWPAMDPTKLAQVCNQTTHQGAAGGPFTPHPQAKQHLFSKQNLKASDGVRENVKPLADKDKSTGMQAVQMNFSPESYTYCIYPTVMPWVNNQGTNYYYSCSSCYLNPKSPSATCTPFAQGGSVGDGYCK